MDICNYTSKCRELKMVNIQKNAKYFFPNLKFSKNYNWLSLKKLGIPDGAVVKNLPANAGDTRYVFHPWVGKIPLEKETATHFSILAWAVAWTEQPGRLYSPWGGKESDMTEHTHTDKYMKFRIFQHRSFTPSQGGIIVQILGFILLAF